MSSSEASGSDILHKARTKHRHRLWMSRILMIFLFTVFLFSAYQLLGRLVGVVVVLTFGMVYLMERNRRKQSITDMNEKDPTLLLRNIVKSLSRDYGIEEPEVIVTNEGDFNKHLFVTKENGDQYLCVSTVYLDLVSGDALAADLAHEFEHLTNGDLYGGRFRRYVLEFFLNSAILLVSIFAVVIATTLFWGSSPILIQWSLAELGILAGSSFGFYLGMKWESRESEWLADIGSMEKIGPEQLARGFIEHQIIFGIPIIERYRDKIRYLLHTHPSSSARIRFAGKVSDISVDEFVKRLDLESFPEKAKKYSEYTPDIDSDE